MVIDQSPGAGTWTSDRKVRLTVSSGPAQVAVPKIGGQTWAQAQRQLDAIGFTYTVKKPFNDRFPANTVISVDPVGGTKLAPDGSVTVLVSQGHAPVNVPDVSKGSYQQAAAVLKALHLKPVRGKDVFDNVIPAGQVVSTLPAAGLPAAYGSVVQVFVSHGPIMTTVPNLFGLTPGDVTTKLRSLGLPWENVGPIPPGGVVATQDPAKDARVPLETTTVKLTFATPATAGP